MSAQARSDVVDVIDSLRSIIRTLRVAGRESEQKLGITSAQLFILQALDEKPDLSINELAEATFTHQSSVSMVVARLAAAKLVTRKPARLDSRRLVVSLTPPGRAVLRKSPDPGQARLVSALRALPRADLSALATNLTTLSESIDNDSATSTSRARAG
jgi:DNA-binding MarR family transcriptional regulator